MVDPESTAATNPAHGSSASANGHDPDNPISNGSGPTCSICGESCGSETWRTIGRTTTLCKNKNHHHSGALQERPDGWLYRELRSWLDEMTGGPHSAPEFAERAETEPEPQPSRDTNPAGWRPVNAAGIPDPLKEQWNWVGIKAEWNPARQKYDKVPYNARTGGRASSTEPAGWSDFATTSAKHPGVYPALGVVLSADLGLTIIDLDDVRDPTTGNIEPWAHAIIARFASYTEISVSGAGVHIVVYGLKPGARCRVNTHPNIEIYSRARVMTVTGDRLDGTPATIEARQDDLNAFYAEIFQDGGDDLTPPDPNRRSLPLSDADVLALAARARNGEKFRRLWAGDLSDYHNDQSAADAGLVQILAFYTQDPAQLDALIRQSGLYRDKWNRDDYRIRTIAYALSKLRDVYRPGHTADTADTAGVPFSQQTAAPADTIIVPTVPLHGMPSVFQEYFDALCRAAGTPTPPADWAVATLLSMVGALQGNRLRLQGKGTQQELPTDFFANVGLPGSGKSPTLAEVLNLMKPLQEEAVQVQKERFRQWREAHKGKGKRGSDDDGDAPPALRNYTLSDITPEALGKEIAGAPGVLMVFDELAEWPEGWDAYAKKGERKMWLRLWASDLPHQVNRVTREAVYVDKAAVSVIGGIQPDALDVFRLEAARDDGMIQRVLWAWPESRPLHESDDDIPPRLIADAKKHIRSLATTMDTPIVVTGFSPEAQVLWRAWQGQNADEQEHLSGLALGFAAKAPRHARKLALMMHALCAPHKKHESISINTLEYALELIEYFREHAYKVYRKIGAPTPRLSGPEGRIVRALERAGGEPVGRDQLRRAATLSATIFDVAIAALIDAGRVQDIRIAETGGRPARAYVLVLDAAANGGES